MVIGRRGSLRRPIALLIFAAFVVAACSAGGAPSGSTPGGSRAPDAAPTPTLAPESTPDLSNLRVNIAGWKTDFSRTSIDLGELLGGGPPKDGIPAVDAPTYESIAESREWLEAQAPVISIAIAGEARAYPLAILMWHEIANDTLGGTPIVVTFCPLCDTALVFERTLAGIVHDFGTTGNLRFSDLVMYDRQTETWWQQATGQAIVGSLTGAMLTFLPAQIISLDQFAATFPEGDVLSRDTGFTRDYGRNPYIGYDTPEQQPFLFDGVIDGRVAPKERVATVNLGGEQVAYPYTELQKVGVTNETVGGRPLVVWWGPGVNSALDAARISDSADAGTSGVFDPTVDDQVLTFRRDGTTRTSPIVDEETGSTWSVTGRATAGPLAGTQLTPIVHGDHFWFAWAAFSPDTSIWTAPS